MNNRTTVFCRTNFEGIHRWANAPDEVGFLRHAHRHMFGVQVEMEVGHDDREVEFIMLKRKVNAIIGVCKDGCRNEDGVWLMGGTSCEMLADFLHRELVNAFGERYMKITVDEDGENGATKEYECISEDTRSKIDGKTNGMEGDNGSSADLGFDEYVEKSYKAIQKHDNNKDTLVHWTIGITEEAGEVAGAIKHMMYGGEKVDEEKIAEELGDLLWYIAAMCKEFGISLETVAKLNLAKVDHKFPGGEFDTDRNLARHKLYIDFKHTREYNKIVRKLHKNK